MKSVLGHQTSEAGFQLLVEAFGLAVGQITRHQACLRHDEPTELPPEPIDELGPLV